MLDAKELTTNHAYQKILWADNFKDAARSLGGILPISVCLLTKLLWIWLILWRFALEKMKLIMHK